jgi:rubrerythrin
VKRFSELSEREILSVAVASEEEDNRVYLMFSEDLRERYPATAQTFAKMAEVEAGHRDRLTALYKDRFGPNLVPIRRSDVKSFLWRHPVWLTRNLPLSVIRKESEAREAEAERFYVTAAEHTRDPAVKELLCDLAREERVHEKIAANLEKKLESGPAGAEEAEEGRKRFILEYIQPGLVGLMDGSVSTLAPLFAAAFATHNNWQTFLVGLAASLGAGISMGFAEALSDDGSLSGRGSPLIRGVVCRRHDDRGRPWPFAALSCAGQAADRVLCRDRHRWRHRLRRALDHRLRARSLHADALLQGGAANRRRRRHRAGDGHTDRFVVTDREP